MESQATLNQQTEGFWWVQIVTNEPYLYLFGPFDTEGEASDAVQRYTEDLAGEGQWITDTRLTQHGPP